MILPSGRSEVVLTIGMVTLFGCLDGRSAVTTKGNPHASDTVLATLAGDTARLTSGDRLIWSTQESDGSIVRWQSRELYGAVPEVTLRLVDSDDAPDLFWTIAFEEFLGGMLLLADGDTALQVFATDEMACGVPELRDVSGDGLLDVIDYRVGALTRPECLGDPVALACRDAYPTDWAEVLVQHDRRFVSAPLAVQGFYADLGNRYKEAARELRHALATNPMGLPSPRCDIEMVRALDLLHSRALVQAGNQ